MFSGEHSAWHMGKVQEWWAGAQHTFVDYLRLYATAPSSLFHLCDLTLIHSFIHQVIYMSKALLPNSFEVAGVSLLPEFVLPIPIEQMQLR